jgi:FkbM family methyltransferase
MPREPRAKNRIRRILQTTLGYDRFLNLFALYRWAWSPLDPADRTFRSFLRLVPRDGIAVDVGANVGATTLALARRCRVVHAFEPVPGHARCVRTMAKLFRFRNIVVHELALGSWEGEVGMVLPEKDGARLPGLAHVVRPSDDEGVGITVASSRLDVAARAFDGRVGALKVDVEDSEAEVLEGCGEILERDRPIVLAELWLTENRHRSLSLLAAHGYEAFVLDEARTLVRFDPSCHTAALDFIFLPRARS